MQASSPACSLLQPLIARPAQLPSRRSSPTQLISPSTADNGPGPSLLPKSLPGRPHPMSPQRLPHPFTDTKGLCGSSVTRPGLSALLHSLTPLVKSLPNLRHFPLPMLGIRVTEDPAPHGPSHPRRLSVSDPQPLLYSSNSVVPQYPL
jgi:hypothetical protein